jgi:hypothetical protein
MEIPDFLYGALPGHVGERDPVSEMVLFEITLLLGQDRESEGLLGKDLPPVGVGQSTTKRHLRSWHVSTLLLLS